MISRSGANNTAANFHDMEINIKNANPKVTIILMIDVDESLTTSSS